MTFPLPPLPAIRNIHIEIFRAGNGEEDDVARWGEARWGQSTWPLFAWHDVTPQSVVMKCSWGADDPQGVLTVSAAGSWSITTYDPKRLLDPSNGASPNAQALRPGKPLRLSYYDGTGVRHIVRQGLIDEVDYDLATGKGSLRGTDQVQLMVAAKLPADLVAPVNTLREQAQWLIDQAGLTHLIPVERVPGPSDLLGGTGSFEVGALPGWTDNAWSASIAFGGAPDGARLLRITGNAVNNYPSLPTVDLYPVIGGSYTLSATAKRGGGVLNSRVRVDCYKAGAITSPANLQFTTTSFVTKTQTFIMPDCDFMRVLCFIDGPAPAVTEIQDFDAVKLTGPTPTDLTDPVVGPLDPREQSVWQHILTGAYDALYAAWMDRHGTLRFRSFGDPKDNGFQAGGADGIPISTLVTQGSLQGVFTRITTHETGDPDGIVQAFDETKASIYGDLLLHRDRQVTGAQSWVDRVLADRAGAALQYAPGTLYPQTVDALESILDLGMIDIAHLVVESVDPNVDVAARVLGGTINADTDTGWTAQLSTYIPAKEWEDAEVPIPPTEPPPPNTIPNTVRTYNCIKDSRLAHKSGLDAGNGTDVNLPIGYISPYRNRVVMGFDVIPWADVVSIEKAELLVSIGANSCGAFGSDPKVVVSRLTGSFSEGTYAATCGFATSNSVKYPGPSITSSGAVTSTVPKSTGTRKAIDITAIARAWLSGQTQHGLMIKSAGEDSSKYTTAFYARHHGTAGNRPQLRLTMTVKAP